MSDQHSEKKNATNLSIDRALDILEYSASHPFPMSAPMISRKLGFNKTTTYHLLDVLEKRGYLYKDQHRQYHLTKKLYDLGNYAAEQENIVYIEMLKKNSEYFLSKYPRCDLFLGIISNTMKGMYLYTSNRRDSFLSPGALFPLHATASGKVLLAYADSKLSNGYFEQFEAIKYTPSTIATKSDLLKRLYKIRTEGFCLNEGEYFPSLMYIAVPVFGAGGSLHSALCMGGPREYMRGDTNRIIADLTELSKKMSDLHK